MRTLIAQLLEPFSDPLSRTWWPGLVVTGLVALWVLVARRPPTWTWANLRAALAHPSTRLDVQLLLARQLLGMLRGAPGVAGAYWLATRAVRWLDAAVGAPVVPDVSPAALALIYSLCLFLAWDLSRFLVHLLLHRVPALWAFHQVHHSAELLSPLTFHRIHPVESLLYQLRGAVATGAVAGAFYWLFRGAASELTLFGVPAIGVALNVATGNLRHSQVWIRFPAPLERWLLSPAQHQLHHSADPAHGDANYGTWLALWDRLAGTLRLADAPPARYGLAPGERNHGDDLVSAWLGPFRDAAGRLPLPARGRAAAALLAAAGLARAEEPAKDAEEDETPDGAMIVYDEQGTPRVAGSAHAIGEESLAQFEYNDIERVLSQVPGISTRGEDGYGLRPNIGIRGANSDRSAKITLMEDGVLLAPAPYAAPAAYYFPMTTRLVGVEVFKGPAATRFGPYTVGGAINVLTRPVPRELAYTLDAAGGLDSTFKGHAWIGGGAGGLGAVVEGVHLRTAGFKELDGGGPTGFDHSELMLKGRWAASAAHALELKLGYANETSHETYLGLSLADYAADPYRRYVASADDLMSWHRTQAELAWQVEPSSFLTFRTVAYHHWLTRQWTKLNGFAGGPDLHDLLQQADPSGQAEIYLAILRGEEDTVSEDQVLQIGTNDRRFHSFGVQTLARWEVHGERVGSELEAGLRLHGDDVRRIHTEDPHDMSGGALVDRGEPVQTILDSRSTAQALAAHLHEDLRLGDLHLLPGARLELIRSYREDEGVDPLDPVTRSALLPGAGALYRLTPWLYALAGAYRGFSPVAPGEPEEVLPETSWNYEAGLRLDQGDRRAEVVGFFNDYKNLTGQCTLSGGCDEEALDQQFNGGEVWIYGLEAAAGEALPLPGRLRLPVEAAYALTRSRFRTGFVSEFPQFGAVEIGDSLPYVAEHQASARVTLEHPRFSFGVGAAWRGEMLDEAGVFPATEADIPPLLLVDAAARGQVTPRLALYAVGTNLTGSTALTSWRPFGARPTAPLQVMVGLKLTPPQPEA